MPFGTIGGMKAGPSSVVVKSSEGWKVEVRRCEVGQGFEEDIHGEDKLEHDVDGFGECTEVAAVLMDRAEEDMDWEKMDSTEDERDEASDCLRSWVG